MRLNDVKQRFKDSKKGFKATADPPLYSLAAPCGAPVGHLSPHRAWPVGLREGSEELKANENQ